MRRPVFLFAALAVAVASVVGYFLYQRWRPSIGRISLLRQYWSDPKAHSDWVIQAGDRCGEAPLLFPTDGFLGFLWGDSFRPGHRHQGLDIFGPSGPDGLGETPVIAAYDGYLTRLPDWKASVIVRVPVDPLDTDHQIWLYYTHMADADGRSFISEAFPPGTNEKFVAAGELLGYQGNYSANPDNPTGMHLHFSIVMDDGWGSFRNELEFDNTIDPSPYFGLELNAERVDDAPAICREPTAASGGAGMR
jgi:hypothetical protein